MSIVLILQLNTKFLIPQKKKLSMYRNIRENENSLILFEKHYNVATLSEYVTD